MPVTFVAPVGAPARLLILGGGSVWTPQLIAGLADVLPAGRCEVALHGLDRDRVARVAGFCRASTDGAIPCRESGTLTDAVGVADIILNQVRIGGWKARQEDEETPPRYGMVGDETLGIGGLRTAIRTRPWISHVAALTAASGRQPWILNLTNPNDIVCRFWRDGGLLNVVGLCELPQTTIAGICAGTPYSAADFEYLGANHMGWVIPRPTVAAAFSGPLPTSWRSHASQPEALVAAQRSRPCRAQRLEQVVRDLRAAIEANDHRLYQRLASERDTKWYPEVVIPLIQALLGLRPTRLVLGLPNCGRSPGVPRDVEIEAWVDAREGRLRAPDLPAETSERFDDIAGLCAIREMAYQAAVDPQPARIRELAARDPFIGCVTWDDRLIDWIKG
jgi:6-phospho-beta-glucosidase